MFTQFHFPSMDTLRKQCDALLKAAMQSEDWRRACRLSFIKGYLLHEDCLMRRNWHQLAPQDFLPDLGYPLEEVLKKEERIAQKAKFKGKLQYTDQNGNIHIREAILDPEVEEYYAFEHFGFFKIHIDMGFYSLNGNNEWEYDAEAERRYYDPQYDYQSAKIIRE